MRSSGTSARFAVASGIRNEFRLTPVDGVAQLPSADCLSTALGALTAETGLTLAAHGVIAPAMTRWPTSYPIRAAPIAAMIPTGSWPTMRPGATGYSPFRMCTSVPQIVVVVTRSRASVGPISGIGRSCNSILPGATNTAAFIVGRRAAGFARASVAVSVSTGLTSVGYSLASQLLARHIAHESSELFFR